MTTSRQRAGDSVHWAGQILAAVLSAPVRANRNRPSPLSPMSDVRMRRCWTNLDDELWRTRRRATTHGRTDRRLTSVGPVRRGRHWSAGGPYALACAAGSPQRVTCRESTCGHGSHRARSGRTGAGVVSRSVTHPGRALVDGTAAETAWLTRRVPNRNLAWNFVTRRQPGSGSVGR